jgi:hypothetical protein
MGKSRKIHKWKVDACLGSGSAVKGLPHPSRHLAGNLVGCFPVRRVAGTFINDERRLANG